MQIACQFNRSSRLSAFSPTIAPVVTFIAGFFNDNKLLIAGLPI